MNPLYYKLKQKKTNNINIIKKKKKMTTTSTILCACQWHHPDSANLNKNHNSKWLILKVKQILVFKKTSVNRKKNYI